MTVLNSLHNKYGFRKADGWFLRIFEGEVIYDSYFSSKVKLMNFYFNSLIYYTYSNQKNYLTSAMLILVILRAMLSQCPQKKRKASNAPVKKVKQTVKTLLKVKYLIHVTSGAVSTSQYKAWNDTIRMAIFIELVLKPYAAANGDKLVLWMDNYSVHKVNTLKERYAKHGIEAVYLPRNMI